MRSEEIDRLGLSTIAVDVKCVRCVCCGRLCDIQSNTYLAVNGNISIGVKGGIIGDNLSHNGLVQRATIFCLDCVDGVRGDDTEGTLFQRIREAVDTVVERGKKT